ncbi:MAG: histidine phosphatase family protein [Peptoniphilus sp.]|nr:histidine phosphatase family protein [Peptoniphilus sp.]MDD7363728.1 histidine phosphatase family protein [Bacillota bacterium]MDY6044113.1 histidine phosphatase family protein [Peptoniphilus sp.]
MAIYMIRHGKTMANIKKYFGGEDEPLLSMDEGTRRDLIERVGKLPISRIEASPYKRTRQTAEVISRGLSIPIEIEPLIREIGLGVLEGYTFEEASEIYGDELKPWLEDPYREGPPEGESLNDVYNRAETFLKRVREDTLYVSHDGFIRAAISVLKKDITQFFEWRIDNLEIVDLSAFAH